ncbi:heat-inducible transcriptional repressor HrcA [soil metagenome]
MGHLDSRKAAILSAIVRHYVRTGEPAGSRTLVEQYALGVSPATVRNEMAALEEAEYIYQPHTSAGRVPTDAGYRHFVDALSDHRLTTGEQRRIQRFFGQPVWELEEVLRQAATLLSKLTNHAAVVFAPALDRSVVRHVQLVPLSAGRAMLVLLTDTGRVEDHVVSVPEDSDEVQLESAAGMLNRIVQGVYLIDAPELIAGAADRFPLELRAAADSVARVLTAALGRDDDGRVFLEGTSNMVDRGKFADLESVRQVIGALEHRRLLFELLAESLAAGRIAVRIGAENAAREMRLCSVIIAPYGGAGQAVGSLGIVGPTRMDYGRTIPAVSEVAASLGRMLTGTHTPTS